MRTSGSFRLIHIDEFGVDRDQPALFRDYLQSGRHGYIRLGEFQTQIGQAPGQVLRRKPHMDGFGVYRDLRLASVSHPTLGLLKLYNPWTQWHFPLAQS